jgi:hypothetical protein
MIAIAQRADGGVQSEAIGLQTHHLPWQLQCHGGEALQRCQNMGEQFAG